MILIAHRGNINGKNPKMENSPVYLWEAIHNGYNVEADVWYDNGWWLGHDKPIYKIDTTSLHYFWCHAKNSEALELLSNSNNPNYNYFWHQEDTYTLTSNGYVWVYPTKQLLTGSICVLPEQGSNDDIHICGGICSDYIIKYKYLENN